MHDVVSQEQKKKEAMIDEFIASRSVESTTATADAASFYCTKKQAFTLSLVDTRDNRSVPAAMKTVVLAGNWRVTLPSKAALSEFFAPEERSPQAESRGGAPQHKRCKALGCTKYMVGKHIKHITDGYCLTCFREQRNGKTNIS